MYGPGTATLTMVATAAINPSTFVMVDPATKRGVKTATANAVVLGVSERGTRIAPGLDQALFGINAASGNACAIAGDSVGVFKAGDLTVVVAGAGGFTYGSDLMSDANGNAVLTTAAGQNVAATALDTVSAGGLGLVLVQRAIK